MVALRPSKFPGTVSVLSLPSVVVQVGFMFGQYKRLRNEWVGILTGKGCEASGSLL